jgi:uncharacterized membrane protein (UPF0127 family)
MRFLPQLARLPFTISVILGLLLFASHAEDVKALRLPVDPAPLIAETGAGQRRFSIEIADEPHERAAGLMFREEMPDNHGMLFVFPHTWPVAFWMKNTPMPLDLVFVGEDGRVLAVLPGVPYSEASIGPGVLSRFVLELKRGTAAANGIVPGVRLRHPLIDRIAG